MVKYGIEQEHIVFTGVYSRDMRELGTRIALALDTVRPLHADRGFAAGAAERISDTHREIVEQSGNGTELVLSSRRDRVDAVFRPDLHAQGAAVTGSGCRGIPPRSPLGE